jgi:hypothetical protein
MHQNSGTKDIGVDSAVAGLNDSLEFLGKQLHVQTERIGLPSPRIVTQVFSNGRVVLSKKSDLPFQSDQPEDATRVHELMRTQHFQVIREIKAKQKRILGTHTSSR